MPWPIIVPDRHRVVSVPLKYSIFAVVIAASALASAQECRVASVSMPDAQELRKIQRERAAFLAASRAPPVARAPAEIRPGASSAGGGTFGVAGASRGDAADPFRGMTKEIEVKDGDKTVRMRVPLNVNEQQVLDSLRRKAAAERAQRPLSKALEDGDAQKVRQLIASGEDVRVTQFGAQGSVGPSVPRAARWWSYRHQQADGDGVEQEAISKRYVEIIKLLLDAGSDVAGTDQEHGVLTYIPLRMKAGVRAPGALELARYLMERGARLDLPPEYPNVQPMQAAARDDEIELLDLMLRHGRPTQASKDAALLDAFLSRQWKAAVRLLDAGADPNVRRTAAGQDTSPLLEGVITDPTARDAVKAMIRGKVDLNVNLRAGFTALMWVMHDHELMKTILDSGADPNATSAKEGMTALHIATIAAAPPGFQSEMRHIMSARVASPETRARSVALLLRHGAKPDAVDRQGWTPLMLTSSYDGDTIALLLAAGASRINTSLGSRGGHMLERNPPGPVGWALMRGNETLALALLKKRGAGREDCGAEYYAAAGGYPRTLQTLLDMRRPGRIESSEGQWGPLHAAAAGGHVSTTSLLLDRRAYKVDERTPRGEPPEISVKPDLPLEQCAFLEYLRLASQAVSGGATPLMLAASSGRAEIVQMLLEGKAAVNAADNAGRTPLDYARSANQAAVERILEQRGGKKGSGASFRGGFH